MADMKCWTGAGTEVPSGAARGSWELSDPPWQQELGARGGSSSLLLCGSQNAAWCSDILCIAAHNVPAKASWSISLAAFAVPGLPPVFQIILCWHKIGEGNCKFKRQMSRERFLISSTFLLQPRHEKQRPLWHREVPSGCSGLALRGWLSSRALLDTLPQWLLTLEVQQCPRGHGAPQEQQGWSPCPQQLGHLGRGALPPAAGTAAGSTHTKLLFCSLARLAEWEQPSPAGTAQSNKMDPKVSYFSPDLESVLTLLGLCHLMLLLKVSPRILMWAACLAYLMLLSVGSNLIYQIDSILFRWVIFHLPLVKLFPRFPRALYWARCYFVFICCHWVILFISVE